MYHCNSISFILYLSGSLWRVKAWGRRQDVGWPGEICLEDLWMLCWGEWGERKGKIKGLILLIQAKISTIDMLHHIEMRMETLTQELEVLNSEKVWHHQLYGYQDWLCRWNWPGWPARWREGKGRRRPEWRSRGWWRPRGTRQLWTGPWPLLIGQWVGGQCSGQSSQVFSRSKLIKSFPCIKSCRINFLVKPQA